MKILLGVDASGRYRSALTILARLGFAHPHLTLLHVDEQAEVPVALPHTPTFFGRGSTIQLSERGYGILDDAAKEANEVGIPSDTLYEAGRAADQLLLQDIQLQSDLVAIGSRSRSEWAATLFGSVGHALATESKSSFLVAHGEVAPAGGLRCLFAIDFSEFSERALDRFCAWVPCGLEHLTLFHAIEPQHSIAATFGGQVLVPKDTADNAIRRATETSKRLEKRGIRTSIQVRVGHAAPTIDTAMRESRADLLVLGARGHGFLERLFLGSVATKLADSATYPVLVIRP